MRSKLQEAEQARRSGTRLGAAGTEADWMAAVRLGRKRRAVGAETLSEITVSPADSHALAGCFQDRMCRLSRRTVQHMLA